MYQKFFMLFLVVCNVLTASCVAHNLQIEKQVVQCTGGEKEIACRPWENDGDSSFENPFDLKWSVQTSQAVFSYLDTKDYDVFRFTLDFGNGSKKLENISDKKQAMQLFNSPIPLLITSALPPACFETLQNFPAVALVAPLNGGTSAELLSPSELSLPFDVPDGYGVLPAFNTPPAEGEQRLIYTLSEGAEAVNLSWFLPNGCFFRPSGGLNCSNSTSLSAPLRLPNVPYYVVVWDPSGIPQDYTLNIGIDERFPGDNDRVRDLVRNNKFLHTPCTAPYADS